ncbi:MAG TPA: hypothetical protein PKX37_10740 [Flexilinea sp.]|nr:hypothetical protein [Flexilinea sp.]
MKDKKKSKARCPFCGGLLMFPGNALGQVAALCDRCQRQTKFYYPEDAQELIEEIQGWRDERNDDKVMAGIREEGLRIAYQ